MSELSSQEKMHGDESGEPIRELYKKAASSIRKETHEYWLNHAFIDGDQWLFWNNEARRLEQVPRDPDRVQVTIDRIGPSSRTIISKLISRDLQFDVPPTGADDATLQGAYTSLSIINSLKVEHDWEQAREQAMWAVWKGGTAAIAIEWDASAGDPIGATTATGRELGTGDTIETVLSITEFVVEPGVRDAEKARWWIKAVALPPEHVQAMYNLPEMPAADAMAGMSPVQSKLMASSSGSGSDNVDLTLVLTYYERPNPKTPKGKVCTVVGGSVVDGPHPWPFPFTERLNLVIIRESIIDGKWIGHTVVSKARGVQVAYNASWSSIIEHMKLAGNARLMVPHSSIDMIDEMSDLPGEMVPYPDGMEKPGFLSPPQMPAWWIEQPDRLADQLDDILGVHEVSRGEMPSNIESGVGLSILAENDSTPTGRLIKDTARAFGLVATLVLKIYEKNVKETRSAIVQVPGYPPETTQWTGADLQGQTRATVPVDAIQPRSKAAMQAFAQKAMEMGLIKTFAQYAELAELPDTHSIIEAVAPDIAKARRENHALALGRVQIPAEFDDHAVHIQEHNDFRKSPKYDLITPEQRKTCDLHVRAHETLDAERLGRQLRKAQTSPVLASGASANGSAPLLLEGGIEGGEGAPPMPGEMMPPEGGDMPMSPPGDMSMM